MPDRKKFALHLLVAIALALGIAQLIDESHVAELERDVFHFLNGGPDWLYWPVWTVMQFGNLFALLGAAAIALFRRLPKLTAGLILALPFKLFLTDFVKDNVVRYRPAQMIDDVIVRHAPTAGQAFVSGHAVVAVVIATVADPYLEGKLRIAVWTLAALVCVGRVYTGAHLPLDVIGGAAVGWVAGSLVNIVFHDHRPEQEHHSEGLF